MELAIEISEWKADTKMPEWVLTLADNVGLDYSRQRKPKKSGMNGGLANPQEVVVAFMQQVPAMISSVVVKEQDAFISEMGLAGQMAGLAGSFEFQKNMLGQFAEGNQMFRQMRNAGLKQMNQNVAQRFTALYSEACDVQRSIDDSSNEIEEQKQEFGFAVNQLKAAMLKVVEQTEMGEQSDEA